MSLLRKKRIVSLIQGVLVGLVAPSQLLFGSAYADMLTIPVLGISVPMPSVPPATAPGGSTQSGDSANMQTPQIPSVNIPVTTPPPTQTTGLYSGGSVGQLSPPVYGHPGGSNDSTGAGGANQNLATACTSSGGIWSGTNCSMKGNESLFNQCEQMGGVYNNTKQQCQMASLPGSGGGAGGWVVGEWMPAVDSTGYAARVVSIGGSDITLQVGHVVSYPAGTCATVNINIYQEPYQDWSGNNSSGIGYCSAGGTPDATLNCDSSANSCSYDYTCPAVYANQWSGSSDSCSAAQLGQTRPAYTYFSVSNQWDVTNITSVSFAYGIFSGSGYRRTSSHTAYNTPWFLTGNPYQN